MSRPVITVETSLPIYELDQVFPHDRTFSELVSRIQDEIDDTTDEYIEQVQKCIFSAIRYCERDTFYFNQNRDVTFETRAGQGRYGSADVDHIATAVQVSEVYVERGGDKSRLQKILPSDMENMMMIGDRGKPRLYSYYDRSLYLNPVPDDIYTIRLILTPLRVADIREVTELSVWFTEAFDLIKSRAKFELYTQYLKDDTSAVRELAEFEAQLRLMRYETSKRANTGRLIPTEF